MSKSQKPGSSDPGASADFYGDGTDGSLVNHAANVLAKRKASRGKKRRVNALFPTPATAMVESIVERLSMWRECGLELNDRQVPFCNERNACQLLQNHPDWKTRIWFDEFHGRVYRLNGAAVPEQWLDTDDIEAAVWVQRDCGMPKMGVDIVRRAVNLVARKNTQNECRNWLESLHHDGIERLEHFLTDVMGSADDEYTRCASRNFWLSLAARALQPGCQVDNMLILEGAQGIGKSSALRLVGGDWYSEAHESLRDKDFFLSLQGKLLVEITEMDAFGRADTARVKQVVTCRVDRYRSPYGARSQDHPRFTVFCGTTNDNGYLRDATGARRFWPVRCGEIRLELLREQREQLFAEAVARFRRGEPWWQMPEEATRQAQEDRRHADPWEDAILSFVSLRTRVSIPDVLGDLGLEVKHFDKQAQMRVADVLTAHGWRKSRQWEKGRYLRLWTNETS
jgi:predicted P-loop ATPase